MRSRLLGLMACAVLLTACGGGNAAPKASQPAAASPASSTPPPAAAKTAKALTPVTLQLAWLPEGDSLPFCLGKVKGFFAAQGIDLTLTPGKGSSVTGQIVAHGTAPFGWMDTSAAITLITKGAPIKVLGVFQQQTPASFIFAPPTQVDSIAQLKGKTIMGAPVGAEYFLLPAILAKGGLTMKDIHWQVINPSDEAQALNKVSNGIVLGYDNADLPVIRKAVPNAQYKPYSDFGVNAYNLGVVANDSFLKSHPGLVRRFMAASVKSWEYAVKHPNQGPAAMKKIFPSVDAKLMGEGFAIGKTLVHTVNTQGHPAGWTSPKDWAESLKMLTEYGGLTHVKPASDYYTNAFIPAQ